MRHDKYSVSEVEEMLQGGRFRPSDALQTRMKTVLRKPPPAFPVPRFALMAGLTALLAALVLTGIVIALSPKERAASVVYGIGSVYEAGLVHQVNDTKQVGDITLTVDWVYADWNQILVGYTAQGQAKEGTHVSAGVVAASLADGTALEGDAIAGYGEMGANSSVATFDMPGDMRDSQAIELQLVLRAQYEHYQTLTESDRTEDAQNQSPPGVSSVQLEPFEVTTTGGGEATFEFLIPVTPGRLIRVDKTVGAKGYAVKLKQVIIAPSMTTARLCFEVPDAVNFHDWIPIVTLTTGINNYGGAGSEYKIGDTSSCQRVEIRESVPLDRNRYAFRVDELIGFTYHGGEMVTTDMLPDEQWRIKGPWVFVLED